MTPRLQTSSPPPVSPHAKQKARAHAKAQRLRDQEVQRLQAMPILRDHAAGIDLGGRTHWVCVGFTDAAPSELVREFPSHTDGLLQIIAYLREHQVNTVALEATGVYWVPLLEMLQQHGFDVILVDPGYTRQLRGRPKTDRKDAQWIYRLHSVGLLPAAFRPDEAIAVLRSYVRHRSMTVRQAGQCIQRMQKALEQMNLKLTTVLDDITGCTGQRIIQAILRGTRDPLKLAQHRHPGCHHSGEEIAQALRGNYREEHVFALRWAYETWRFYQGQLDKVDACIGAQLEKMAAKELPPLSPRSCRSGRKANDPRFDARAALYAAVGMDLTELEGLSEATVLTLVSEVGLDMSRFPTVKHFCSWLGLCPHWRKTGGKVKSSRTRAGPNRAATALRLAAGSLHRSRSALGAYLRRMKSRLGAPAALTATAHKLARLVYWSLSKGLPYAKQTQAAYEEDQRQRALKNLYKQARRLGLEVVERAASSDAPAGGAVGSPS